MENFVLEAAVQELEQIVKAAGTLRLGKIYSLGTQALALDPRLNDGRILYLSASPSDQRFYLSSQHPRTLEAQTTGESPLVQRLRKELSGAHLTAVTKLRGERSITLTLAGYATGGEPRTTLLRLDLTGRSSNLYWMDLEEKVLDLLRPVDSVIIGTRHTLPVQDGQQDWDEVTSEHFPASQTIDEDFLRRYVRGCGATLVREVAARALRLPAWEAFVSVREALHQPPQAWLYSRLDPATISLLRFDPRRDLRVATFPLEQCAGWHIVRFQNIHQATEEYFNWIDRHTAFMAQRQPWQTALSTHLKRLQSAYGKVTADETPETEVELWKRYGDLIFANIKTGRRTETGLQVVDYYTPEQPEIEIPVPKDEPLTVAAQKYFRKYQKHQRAQTALAERAETLEKHLASAQSALELLATAETAEDLERIIPVIERSLPLELRPKLKTNHSKRATQNSQWSGLRHYRGPSGFEIYVGRTDRDNDRLTFKLARSQDVWLHAADYPGAHVLVRNPNRNAVPQHVIQAAAELAAFFSQARNDDKVNVHYAERKHLSRPRHSPPGLVLLTDSKTVLATPREALERVLD